jgi:CubicO group peptidase (beta-lactamase class C family)
MSGIISTLELVLVPSRSSAKLLTIWSDAMTSTKDLALTIEQVVEKEQRLSGAVLISQSGEVVFEKAYGFASRQLNVPNVLDSKFHIASMTKMFIAMAALILSEQGLIDLHEKPAAYMPELAALDTEITLHHLLSHTSGMRDIYDVPHLRFEMLKLKIEQGNLLSYLVQQPQLFHPGQGWSYSSTGYILTGYLLETVTGLSFAEVMRHYVLEPLNMTNTGLDLPERINPGRVYGHTEQDGHLVNADNDKLSVFEAPGELYSTVQDLKKWCDAMFNCPVVSPSTLQLMFTPHAQVNAFLHYGYGWFLAPLYRMHGGQTPGFRARIKQYPEQQVSIILLCNSDQTNLEHLLNAIEPVLVG